MDLASLEEKINALISLVKKLQQEKQKLEEENRLLHQKLIAKEADVSLIEKLEAERDALIKEREEIKARIETLLKQLETFELENISE